MAAAAATDGMRASDKTVFIRRLPYDLTDEALEDAVSQIGPVKSCFTVKDRATRKCRGFGYALFCTREDAERALNELKRIGGRQVSVSMATKRKRKRKRGKTAITKNDHIESNLPVDEEHGSIAEEDVDGGSSLEDMSGKVGTVRPKSQRTHPFTAVGRTLVVTGFPEGVTKKQFYKCCRKFGEVEQLEFPIEGRLEVTASVVYKSYPESRKALQKLEGKIFKGAMLKAVVKSREGKSPSQKALRKSRLIIRNLSFAANEEDVKSICAPFGVTSEVKIPRKEGGKKRGFAFVQFTNVFSAGQAMEALNGSKIKGRVVAVDWVVPKDLYETAKDTEAVCDIEEQGELAGKEHSDSTDNEEYESGPESNIGVDDESRMETTNRKETDLRLEMDNNDSDEDDVTTLQVASEDEEEEEEEEEEGGEEEGEEEEEEEEGEEEEGEEEGEEEEGSSEDESNNDLTASTATTPQRKKKKASQRSDVQEGKTIFIRNLPFDCGEEDISEAFAVFGDIVYCKQVINHETDVPKGTAFVKYSQPAEAQKCIDASSMDSKGIVLGGRRLAVSLAVTRQEAESINKSQKEKSGRDKDEDKRNLYLAKEGQIHPDSDAARGLSKADLGKRMKAAKEKKAKLGNPNYFVSKTRLSVRNLPTSVDEKQLKSLFLDEAGGCGATIKQVKILRDSTRLNSSGVGRSRGHGFVEFATHESALMALRAVNNNPDLFGPQKRPIVEFAIEDARALKLRADRQLRQKKLKAELAQTSGQKSHRRGKVHTSKGIPPVTKKAQRMKKSIDRRKTSVSGGKGSKQARPGDSLQPAHTDEQSPQPKSRKRRASDGEMQERRLNAMIEDYKRKVFRSQR